MIKNILVDLSNFAFSCSLENSKKKVARYENIRVLMEFFKSLKKDYQEIIVVFLADATLKHRIDEREKLLHDIRVGDILEAPASSRADEYLLEFLNQNPDDTIIVSNDRFQDYSAPSSTLTKWRFPGMIICSQFIIPGLVETFEREPKVTQIVKTGMKLEGGT